jgi:hypothetical protein
VLVLLILLLSPDNTLAVLKHKYKQIYPTASFIVRPSHLLITLQESSVARWLVHSPAVRRSEIRKLVCVKFFPDLIKAFESTSLKWVPDQAIK